MDGERDSVGEEERMRRKEKRKCERDNCCQVEGVKGTRTHGDLVELAEIQRAVAVDGRPDVLAVLAALHRLHLPHTADIGQPGLDLRHVQHLRHRHTPQCVSHVLEYCMQHVHHFMRYLLYHFFTYRSTATVATPLQYSRAGVSNWIPRWPECLQVFVVSFQSAVN